MKKVLISILTFMLIVSMTTILNAATSGSITTQISKETIKAGDEFTITISASDTDGLNTVEYTGITITDENGSVTNDIQVENIAQVNDTWSKMTESSSTFFMYTGSETQTSDVFTVTLKANDTITAGTYTINIEGLKVYNKIHAEGSEEEKLTDVGTKSISVKAIEDTTTIDKEDTPSTTTTGGKTTKTTSKSGSNNSGSGDVTTSGVQESSADKELPQTGLEVGTVVGMIALAVVAIGSYISYKKYNV